MRLINPIKTAPKIFLIIPLVIFLLVISCNKESDTPEKPTGRGSVVSYTDLQVYNKALIKAGLFQLAGTYVDTIEFNYDVKLVKVLYNTIDGKGQATVASGLLLIPVNPGKPIPLLSYQHGTILKKADVPSRKGGGYELGLITGTIGYATACPDYLGLGDGEGLHPYMHAKTEATAIVDMIKASKQVCSEKGVALNDQLFLLGYSQGGHSTMAALKDIEENHSSEMTVTACSAMAGAYDLSGIQLNYMFRDTFYEAPGYLPYLMYGYNEVYNMYPNLDTMFKAPYNTQFPSYFTDNTTLELGSVNALWPSTRIPSEVLNPNVLRELKQNPDFPIFKALKDNNLYDWEPVSPLLLCHCDKDMHVPYQHSVLAYNTFISKGATKVKFVNPFPGGDHTTCVLPSMVYTIKWFNSLKQ
jgi:hypothetical protein